MLESGWRKRIDANGVIGNGFGLSLDNATVGAILSMSLSDAK